MTSSPASRIMLDNSTVAGAGRALYDILPDSSDCRSLMHLITATLFYDEIHIDGSSRQISVNLYDAEKGEHKTVSSLPAIWTWERRYPAIKDICYIVDGFWQRSLGFNKENIVDFALAVLNEGGSEFIKDIDFNLVPSIYLSNNYFDRNWLAAKMAEIESQMHHKITEDAFKVLLYAWRGIYYYELSKLVGITYFAHPQRNQFIEPFMVAGKSIFDYDHTALTFLSKVICEPAYKLIQTHATEKSKDFCISVFPFAAHIINKCSESREEIVKKVSEFRDDSQMVELRGWIRDYDIAYRRTDILEIKKLQIEINSSMKNFAKRYGVEDVPLKIVPRLPISELNITGLDQTGVSLNLPRFLFAELFQKPYLSLMWGISREVLHGDLVGVEQTKELSPISSRNREIEWILMESASSSLHGDVYLKGNVANADRNNLYDLESFDDLIAASSRPAAVHPLKNSQPKLAERSPNKRKGRGHKRKK